MAARPKGYGLTAEVKGKIDAKYDPAVGRLLVKFIIHTICRENRFLVLLKEK